MTKQIEVETLRDWLDAQRPVTVQVRRTGKACLSYIAGSAGEAAVIDPSVPSDVYLELASRDGCDGRT